MAGELPAAPVSGGDVSEPAKLWRRWLRCLLAQVVVVAWAGASCWELTGVFINPPGMAVAKPWLFRLNVAWLGKVTMDQHAWPDEIMEQSNALENAQSQTLD